MSRIFISYSSKSKNLVSSLAEDIETANHQIWFDHKLTGGQSWWDQILDNIRQCDLFIFALTPDALTSYACQLEYRYAYQLKKNILPVLVADGVSANLLPPELSVIQFVDYRSQDKLAAFRLMTALNNLPAPQPLPDPLPEAPAVPISYLGNLKEQVETTKTLNFEEQTTLVFKLRERLREGDNPEDVLGLLRQMKRRDDLLAKIEKEIDAVIHSATPAQASEKNVDMGSKAQPEVEASTRSTQATERGILQTFKRFKPQLILGTISALIWGLSSSLSYFGGVSNDLPGSVVIYGIAIFLQVITFKRILHGTALSIKSIKRRQILLLVGGLILISLGVLFVTRSSYLNNYNIDPRYIYVLRLVLVAFGGAILIYELIIQSWRAQSSL